MWSTRYPVIDRKQSAFATLHGYRTRAVAADSRHKFQRSSLVKPRGSSPGIQGIQLASQFSREFLSRPRRSIVKDRTQSPLTSTTAMPFSGSSGRSSAKAAIECLLRRRLLWDRAFDCEHRSLLFRRRAPEHECIYGPSARTSVRGVTEEHASIQSYGLVDFDDRSERGGRRLLALDIAH